MPRTPLTLLIFLCIAHAWLLGLVPLIILTLDSKCHLVTCSSKSCPCFSKGWGRNAAQGCRNVSAAAIPIGLSASPRTPGDVGPLPPSSPLPRFANPFGKTYPKRSFPRPMHQLSEGALPQMLCTGLSASGQCLSPFLETQDGKCCVLMK